MIDFTKTGENVSAFRNRLDQMDASFQAADQMAAICKEVAAGKLERFDEHDRDAFSAGFVGWTRHRGLLVLV